MGYVSRGIARVGGRRILLTLGGLDEEFTVVWANKAVEEYFGLNREAILGADKRHLVTNHIKDRFANPDRFAERVPATYDDYVENFESHICATETTNDRWLEHWSQPIESGPYTVAPNVNMRAVFQGKQVYNNQHRPSTSSKISFGYDQLKSSVDNFRYNDENR